MPVCDYDIPSKLECNLAQCLFAQVSVISAWGHFIVLSETLTLLNDVLDHVRVLQLPARLRCGVESRSCVKLFLKLILLIELLEAYCKFFHFAFWVL